jgi:hypothetical protein
VVADNRLFIWDFYIGYIVGIYGVGGWWEGI